MRPMRHPLDTIRKHLRRHPDAPRGARRVAEGAAAYLDGSIGQYLQRSEGVVPAWTWVSAVAHADVARLRLLSSGDAAFLPRGLQWRKWRRATAVMAQEVLSATAGSERALRAMQRGTLQPLEERMAFGGRPMPWTPEHLAGVVIEATHGATPGPRQEPRRQC